MRVLLFYPNLYGMNMLPPAIGLFSAILKRDGHSVNLFDTTIYEGLAAIDSDKMKSDNLNARPFDDTLLKERARKTDAIDDFKQLVRQFAPDLIAMSVTEDMYPIGLTLLSALGAHRPKVVAGGVFPTFAPKLALQLSNGCIDYVLKGEGDETLAELCRRLEAGSDLKTLDGLHAVLDGVVVNNGLPRPVDLQTLPEPDYDLSKRAVSIGRCRASCGACSLFRPCADVRIRARTAIRRRRWISTRTRTSSSSASSGPI